MLLTVGKRVERKNVLSIMKKWVQKEVFLSAVLFCFLVAVGLKVHGFSLSAWAPHLGKTPKDAGLLFGESRPIRSDEYNVIVPMYLSQRSDAVAFSTVNKVIGFPESNINVNFPLPSKSIYMVFRPHLWGFLLSSDFGLSWLWNFRVISLITATFLFLRYFRMPSSLAGVVATGFAYSPFFVFWTYDREPMVSWGLLLFLACSQFFNTKSKRELILYSLAILYSLNALIWSAFYPAWQIQVSLMVAVLVLAELPQWVRNEFFQKNRLAFLGTFTFIGVVTFGMIGYFVVTNQEQLKLLTETVYPGKRFEVGGNLDPTRLFLNTLFPLPNTDQVHFSGTVLPWLGNICEAASFYVVFPLIFFGLLFSQLQSFLRSGLGRGLLIWISLVVLYCFVGFFPLLARVTLFSKIPATRMLLSFGLIQLVFFGFCFRILNNRNVMIQSLWKRLAIISVVLFFLVGLFLARDPHLGTKVVIGVSAFAMIGFTLLSHYGWGLVLVSVATVVTTFGFTPTSIGGTDVFYKNPVAENLKTASTSVENARMAVFDHIIVSNLPRILGIQSINGVHFYPQNEIWRTLDPESRLRSAYNRHAHVILSFTTDTSVLDISSPQSDVVLLRVSPDNSSFLRLPLTHLLIPRSPVLHSLLNWSVESEFENWVLLRRRSVESISH